MDKQIKGIFITIDGPNASGKTSLAEILSIRLEMQGVRVVLTKQPSASILGKFVRDAEAFCKGQAYAHLIAADRYWHIEQEVLPALNEGKVVVCARYVESSLVLQRLDGLQMELIWEINRNVLVPDLSVILRVPARVLATRLKERLSRSRFEKEHDRHAEVQLYEDSATFLSVRGFNVMSLENAESSLDENANLLLPLISDLIQSKEHI